MTNRGIPRTQYSRTYVLLPPNAGEAWATAVIDATWDDHRYTLGWSADDAGIGDLDVRRIIAVNPQEWPGDLMAFYAEHYPYVQYYEIRADEPDALMLKLLEPIEWPAPEPWPQPEAFPIRGLHDLAGADWMLQNGLQGWCCVPAYLGTYARAYDFTRYERAGIRVIVNLRYSYAVDDGGQGTIAPVHELDAFENAVIQTVFNSRGVWGWCYCNEMNNPREWPRGTVVTPAYYLESYNNVWKRLTPLDLMSPGAIDPYNPGWGNWRDTWREVLQNIRGADFWALHAYSHGRFFDPDQRFGDFPLAGVFYNLRVLEDQAAILPFSRPVIVTETNHLLCDDGTFGWEDYGAWVSAAYQYFRAQGVEGACLFRYGFDRWNVNDKPSVLEAMRE